MLNSKRINMNLPNRTIEVLERLKVNYSFSSVTEVVRKAILLLSTMYELMHSNGSVVVKKEDGTEVIILLD